MKRCWRAAAWWTALGVLWGAAGPALAEPPERAGSGDVAEAGEGSGGPRAEKRRLQAEWFERFEKGDLAGAEAKLRRLVEIDRKNFVPWYNLACVLAEQGRIDDAMSALEESITWGFADLRRLQTDRHLAPLRRTMRYRAIVEGWEALLDAQASARIDALMEALAEGNGGRGRYIVQRDETLRLAYVSAFDESALGRTRAEVDKYASWWEAEVVALAPPPDTAGTPAAQDPWVIMLLPTPRDYARWALSKFGPGWRQVGGSYSDDEKVLVTQDLGGTLRHEFWHALHWRDQRRRGQLHPIWIMEGLCSLVEDVEEGPGGRMRALPSWRTNMAKRRERSGSLMPWEVLFDRNHKRFVTSSPLAHYAEARTIFLYIAEQGKLAEWYAAYVEGFDEDPTGAAAMTAVFGKPLKDVEKDYRAWLRALPEVLEEIPRGGATLPFEVQLAAGGGGQGGDGVTIVSPPPVPPRPQRVRGQPRPPAPPRLRIRDVVTAIDGQPVRDMGELVRVLSKYSVGDEVEVEYRRGTETGTARVTLVAKK